MTVPLLTKFVARKRRSVELNTDVPPKLIVPPALLVIVPTRVRMVSIPLILLLRLRIPEFCRSEVAVMFAVTPLLARMFTS